MLSSTAHDAGLPTASIPRDFNAAVDLIERNLRACRSEKAAFIDDAGTYTYGELARRVDAFAQGLRSFGIQMEQRVVLLLHDTIDFPVAFLGAIKAGIVPIAINTMLTPDQVDYILNDSRACAIVISDSLLERLKPVLSQARFLKQVIVSGEGDHGYPSTNTFLAASHAKFEPAPTTRDDMCFWLYSSGSTGAPKGTVHTHANLVTTAELFAKPIVGYHEPDVVFSVSKLSFAYGLGNALTFPLAAGATSVLMGERPTPAAIVARLRRYRPTVFCSIPTSYAALLSHADLPTREELSLRICVSAGEALPAQVGARWKKHFDVDILDGVGSTEMLHIYLCNQIGSVQYGTCGVPVPGYEVRLVDDDLKPAPKGASGEMHVRGPTSALLYWNNRERTSSTFLGEWVRTGDKFHEREDGRYVYEGRCDDMLKVGGFYVSPFEVESALIGHGAVLEAGVVGRQDSDGLVKPCAYVVLRPGMTATALELQEHVKSLLAPYKYPRWVNFCDDLPKTPTGKVQRFKLRAMT